MEWNKNEDRRRNLISVGEYVVSYDPAKIVKLNNIHKTTKIQEYLESIIDDKDERLDLLTILIDMVNNKKLNTKKMVDYDMENEKIVTIFVLKFNKKKDKYMIKKK